MILVHRRSRDLAAGLVALAAVACGNETNLRSSFESVDPVDVLPCEFSPLSGSRMSVYDCNPVFTSVDEPWLESVDSVAFRTEFVMGHPVFQVWYTGALAVSDTRWGLGHAISADGINWTPHPDNPLYVPTTDWDRDAATGVNIVFDADADAYALTYQGSNLDGDPASLGVGLLTSSDGVFWDEPKTGEPLIDLTRTSRVCWPLGMSWSSGQGYYGFVAFEAPGRDLICQPHRFEADALAAGSLEVDDGPALEAGPDLFDASGVTSTASVELNGRFYMFYVGFESWEPSGVYGFVTAANMSLALAVSDDGVTWRKAEGENPLPVALTSPGQISTVGAQVIGERIHVWVTDRYEDLDSRALGYYIYDPAIELHP